MDRPHPDLDEPIILFAKELAEKYPEREAFEVVGLGDLLDHDKEPNEDIEKAIELHGRKPFRKTIERMLLEHCEFALIREAVYYKFRVASTEDAMEWYRKLFWDNELLDAYDFAKHYERVGAKRRPKPPPVAGQWRAKYVAYMEGAPVDINLESAVEDIFIHSFFRAKELAQLGMVGDQGVAQCHKTALASFKALKEASRPSGRGQTEMPDAFKVELYYPDQVSMEPGGLEGYDPVADSGYDRKEEPDEDE
jgi:hypothetical protein